MKLAPTLIAALAVIGALLLAKECGYREGARQARREQVDARTDSVVVQLRREAADSQKAFKAGRDSLGQVIRGLRHPLGRVRRDTLVVTQHDTLVLAQDSLIAAYAAGRQQDSLQLLFWQAQVAQRDSLINALQVSRNFYIARSQRRLACVGGPSVAVGLNGQGAIGVGVTCGYRL